MGRGRPRRKPAASKVEAPNASAGNGVPESAASEDEIAERVGEAARAARDEAEQLVVGEIEALEADLTAETRRREEAEAEVSRLRAELERRRTEIVEPETDGPAEDGAADHPKAAIIFPAPVSPEQGPRRRRWPFGRRAGGEP